MRRIIDWSEIKKNKIDFTGKADELLDSGEQLAEPFIINEDVKIIDGPFNGFIGSIEEIHNDKKKLKVEVKIFGRKTPVEVTFMQVEKIA